jgi:50S ribosomal protein L16 3-hydroxylase
MKEPAVLGGLARELNWPSGSSAEQFLAEHWQRQPLFMPQALAGIADLLDADELAGLACEPGIEARLIICTTDEAGDETWQLEQGPFDAERFANLPDSSWTLLVQDVDKHLPELAAVFDRFGFLPNWRLDDLMVSYAAPGGTVGPHIDGYDVFLIQGQGSRTWQFGETQNPLQEPMLIPDRPLQQLQQFEPVTSHTMQPGDALYLPPGVSHHGVSSVESMTWSIGFRAPALGQLAANLVRRRLELSDAESLYADPELTLNEADDGLISVAALQRARAFLEPVLAVDDQAELALALGTTITTPKDWLRPSPPEAPMTDSELRASALEDGLTRHGFALLARCAAPVMLFACGETHSVDSVDPALLRDLCRLRELPAGRLRTLTDAEWQLIGRLYRDGILLCKADLDHDPS